MKKNDISSWDTKIAEVPFTELVSKYIEDPEFMLTMPTLPGAAEGLPRLAKTADVFVASTRPYKTEVETNLRLRRNFQWRTPFFNTTAHGKSELQADFLIDDYIGNLKGFVESSSSKTGILFSQPWNANRDSIQELIDKARIQIAEDWKAVLSFIA